MTEHHHPLLERRGLVDDVALSGLPHGLARLVRIEVPRVKDCGIRNLRQSIVERAVQLLGIAPRQIRAATTVEEQRVAGHQAVVDQEALAPGGVTRSVNQLDVDPAQVALEPDDTVSSVLIGKNNNDQCSVC